MKWILSIIIVLFFLASKSQEVSDTMLFKNKWVVLSDQSFIKENLVTTSSEEKYNILKKAILDSDSTLFETAVLYRFLEKSPSEIKADPFHEILIIDINKDSKNDVIFYLSPEIDIYLTAFWVFINDGKTYHEYIMSSGIITSIEFDENGYKNHYTYFGKCCTYPYQIRSCFYRNDSGNITHTTYQTLSDYYPDKFSGEIRAFSLKKDTKQYALPDPTSVDEECFLIHENSSVEILGEENGFWFIRYPVNNKKTDYYLIWIPKQE